MYAERYDNHFLKLQAARDVLADFAKFTVEALRKPGLDKLLAAQLPALQAAYSAFVHSLTERTGSSGQRQTGTQTEEQAATAFIRQVQATNVKLLKPYLFDHQSEAATFYPNKLTGITQAPKFKRLTRFTAYVEALESHAEANLQTAGAEARLLLTAYEAASTARNHSTQALNETIMELTPGYQTLAEALWEVHCAALYVHRKAPLQARTYFAYDKLPNRGVRPKKTGPSK
jgi:hypothetical protein